MNKNKFRYIEVRDKETKEVVSRINITDRPEEFVERTMMGLLMQMDMQSYFTDENCYYESEQKTGLSL